MIPPVLTRGERIRFGVIAAAAAMATASWAMAAAMANRHWYNGLLKPFFAPTPWLAAILFAVVAATAGRALFRLFCRPDYHPDRRGAIKSVLAVLAISAAWSWAFFVGRHPTLSLALAALLVMASALAIRRSALVELRAAALLVPWTLATLLVGLVDLSVRLRNG